MKAEFDFNEEGPVQLLEEIPDEPKLKLLGYNGTGKTLTANVLASISGTSVWVEQEKIESLSEFLPKFNVKLDFEDESYEVEAEVSEWKVDSTSGKLKPQSIGNVYRDSEESSIKELQSKFDCHIIQGNEDIKTRVDSLATKLKRTIFQITNNLKPKAENFDKRFEDIMEDLKQNNLYLEIINEKENLNEKIDQVSSDMELEILLSLPSEIKELSEAISMSGKKSWLDINGPKKSLQNIKEEKNDLKEKIEKKDREIKSIYDHLSEDIEDRIEELSEKKEDVREQIESIDFPWDKDEIGTREEAERKKEELMKKENDLKDSREEYKKNEFRTDFWPRVLKKLKTELDNEDLPQDTKILLESGERNSLAANELDSWYTETSRKSEEKLKEIGDFKDIDKKIENIDKKIEKIDLQRDKLIEENNLKESLKEIEEKLNRYIESKERADKVPELKDEKRKAEKNRDKLNRIESALEDISEYESWEKFLKLSEELDNLEELNNKIRELSNLKTEIKYIKADLEEREEKYLNKFKSRGLDNYPPIIQELVEEGEVEKLCNMTTNMDVQKSFSVLGWVQNDAENAIDHLTDDREEGGKDEEFLDSTNEYLGEKIKNLLNREAFRKEVFDGNEVKKVNPYKNTLTYKDEERDEKFEKYISEYSSGEKAFVFSLASILDCMSEEVDYSLLILDEFGAMLAEDKETYLIDCLNDLQKEE